MNNEKFSITRRIEIDAAHRVPDHKSKCFNIHGHRYVIEATCEGSLVEIGEQNGMVMDFGFLKECMIKAIHDPCDHGMIWYKDDPMLDTGGGATLNTEGWKNYLVDVVPTAENLARIWHSTVKIEIDTWFGKHAPYVDTPNLRSITIWETPNCRATYPVGG